MEFKFLLKTSILFFCISGIVACNPKEPEVPFVPTDNPCDPKLDVFAPIGFDINLLGSIYNDGDIKSFQFVTDEVAFAVGRSTNGLLQIFKSFDGGENWQLLQEFQDRVAEGLAFLNENIGIITADNQDGSCSECSALLKTEDGGTTWEEHIVEGALVELSSPTFDALGNLFAVVGIGGATGVLKSADLGETWETFFNFEENDIDKSAYSLKIYLDKIYVSTYNWPRIHVLNKSGELLETFYSASNNMIDFQVIDNKNIIVIGEEEMHRTISSGEVWTTIYYGKVNFLGYTSTADGVFMLEKSDCPDRGSVNHVLVSTSDGGLTWNEAEQYTTVEPFKYWYSQKTDSGKLVFMFGNKFYELTKQ